MSKEITAIAAKFIGEKGKPTCWVLGECETIPMLEGFRALYDEADIVTGHYIRGFDLPLVNSAMVEFGLPALRGKLSHDTKMDLMKFSGLSKSQESIGAMLGLKHPKVGMNQQTWRSANRLEAHGLQLTRERVVGDVLQHIEMRARLIELGYLGGPKKWSPGGGGPRVVPYEP